MATDLETACGDLLDALRPAEDLLHQPDEDGAPTAAGFSSSPPWNGQVAAVIMDAHEGVRRLEASLRWEVTGRDVPRRGGADAQTAKALEAIGVLAESLGRDTEAEASALVTHWLDQFRRLPAVDELPMWLTLRAGPDGLPPRCRFCQGYQLRSEMRTRVIQCFSPSCPGERPTATLDMLLVGPEAGTPLLRWSDGWIEYAPEPPALEATG